MWISNLAMKWQFNIAREKYILDNKLKSLKVSVVVQIWKLSQV